MKLSKKKYVYTVVLYSDYSGAEYCIFASHDLRKANDIMKQLSTEIDTKRYCTWIETTKLDTIDMDVLDAIAKCKIEKGVIKRAN